MIEYIFLGVVKTIDNIVNAFKSITTYKEQKVISSILVVVSQLIFYLIVSKVIGDNSLLVIIIVSISSGIGNFIALEISGKLKRPAKWTFIITSFNINDIQNLCNYLAENKIKYIASDGYTRKGEHTINVMAFSKSKDDSRLIEEFLKNTESKYLKEII